MTDRQAQFLQTVLENPDADAPRLNFADWLEEHGQGERAELIRAQCELATMGQPHIVVTEPCCISTRYGPNYYSLTGGEETQGGGRAIMEIAVGNRVDVMHPREKGRPMYGLRCSKITDDEIILVKDSKSAKWEGESIRRRATELLAEYETEWIYEVMPKARWMYSPSDRTFDFRDYGEARLHWHRGFIHQIECQLEMWRGRTCERCEGEGTIWAAWQVKHESQIYPGRKRINCPTCHGTGRTIGIGALLVRRAPIESVVVTDKRAYHNGRGYCWYNIDRPLPDESVSDAAALPSDLFEKVAGNFSRRWKYFSSAAAANAALSTALLAEARAALEPSGPLVVQCGT